MKTPRAGWVSLLPALGACHGMAVANDVPARIVNADAASRAALSAVVDEVLRTNVTLADDALTANDVLLIERSPPSGIGQPAAQGRNMDVPIRFRLVQNGSRCLLIDDRDGARYPLADTECAPL